MKTKVERIEEQDKEWRAAYVMGSRGVSPDVLKTHIEKIQLCGVRIVKIIEGFGHNDTLPPNLDLVIISVNCIPKGMSENVTSEAKHRKLPIARLELKWSQAQKVLKAMGVIHENGLAIPPPRCGLHAMAVEFLKSETAFRRRDNLIADAVIKSVLDPGALRGVTARPLETVIDKDNNTFDLNDAVHTLRLQDDLDNINAIDDAEVEAELARLEEEEKKMKAEPKLALVPSTQKAVVATPSFIPPPSASPTPAASPSSVREMVLGRFDADIATIDDELDDLEDEINQLHTELVNAESRRSVFTKRQAALKESRESAAAALAVLESPRVDPVPKKNTGPQASEEDLCQAVELLLMDKKEGMKGVEVRKALQEQQINYGPHNSKVSAILRKLVDAGRVRCAISHERGGYRYWIID